MAAAVAAAERADVVVLALGGRGGWFGTRITEGEGTDVARIELPDHQVALVRAVAATGKPLVGVLFQGRPYAITAVDDLLDAVLVAYYPGPHGARAVAAALFGDTNPGGKLPYTVPRATGQVPIYSGMRHGSGYRRSEGDMFRSYIDLEASPLYPFGHGLSYTSFEYRGLEVSSSAVPCDGGKVTVSVEVANVGDRDGAEVVQFYASGTATGVTRPAQQLVGFRRVVLPAGGRATVTCVLQAAQLGFSGVDGVFRVEPGRLGLAVGGSSDDLRLRADLELVGDTVVLEGRRAFLSDTSVS